MQRVVPAARWDMDAVYSPDILPGKMAINVRSACKPATTNRRIVVAGSCKPCAVLITATYVEIACKVSCEYAKAGVSGLRLGVHRFGGLCDGVDMFDAALFRMSPAEAAATDPQQRILLEETHSALHHARTTLGTDISSFTGPLLLHSYSAS